MAIKKFKNGDLLDSNSIYDSGWKTLSLNSGISVGSLCGTPSYKKVGHKVYIRGGISFTAQGTNTIMVCTIPSAIKPTHSIYKMTSLSGHRLARIGVSTGGNLFIDWVFNIDGTACTSNIRWLDINISFWID